MQPPTSSEDKWKDYKNRVETPDELDMLVTGKNHDLKVNVAVNPDLDDWLLALLTLQTMEGVYGRGKLRHLPNERGCKQQAGIQHHAPPYAGARMPGGTLPRFLRRWRR